MVNTVNMSESKELILSCARDIFLKEGLSHFSMRKVASCVGMSATALYRHYTNKEELLFQVLLRGYRIFSRYLEKINDMQAPLECLEKSMLAYLNFALAEKPYYEVMFMSNDQMTGLKKLSSAGVEEMRHSFEVLQNRVQRAIDQKLVKTVDSYVASFGLWAYAHGQVSLFLSGRAEVSRKQFVKVYTSLMKSYIHQM